MRMFRVVVGGNEYEVGIEEIGEQASAPAAPQPVKSAPKPVAPAPTAPAAKPAAPSAPPADAGAGTIVAAMPGTITDVKVTPGAAVKRGETVLILEAMKMENEIQAPVDGTVSSIEVEKGATVNAGMTLMVIA